MYEVGPLFDICISCSRVYARRCFYYSQLATGTTQQEETNAQLVTAMAQLLAGLSQLQNTSSQLMAGMSQLQTANSHLVTAVAQLEESNAQLQRDVAELKTGKQQKAVTGTMNTLCRLYSLRFVSYYAHHPSVSLSVCLSVCLSYMPVVQNRCIVLGYVIVAHRQWRPAATTRDVHDLRQLSRTVRCLSVSRC